MQRLREFNFELLRNSKSKNMVKDCKIRVLIINKRKIIRTIIITTTNFSDKHKKTNIKQRKKFFHILLSSIKALTMFLIRFCMIKYGKNLY